MQQHHFVVCKGIPRKVDADSIPMIPPGKREPDRSRGVFLGVGTSYSILAVCTNFHYQVQEGGAPAEVER